MIKTAIKSPKFIHKIIAGVILCAILFIYVDNIIENAFYQDDAFTTFRYVKNFIEGNGLVFNTGEKVEGYTNFLWVMILSALGKLGVDYIRFAQYLSVFFGASVLITLYFLTFIVIPKKSNYKYLIALIPPLLLAYNGGFIYWSVSAMETSLFIFLIFAGLLSYLAYRDSHKTVLITPILFLLAALTRPEGVYFYGIIFLFDLLIVKKKGKHFFNFERKALIEFSFFAVPFAIYLLWKLYYFGNILPNTFYAKTGFGIFYLLRGYRYITQTFTDHYYYLILVVPILFAFIKFWKNPSLALLNILIVANVIQVLIVGGDVLPLNRFMLIALPISFVLLSYCVHFVILKMKKWNYPSAVLILLFSYFFALETYNAEKLRVGVWQSYELGLVGKMKEYAKFLNAIAEEKGYTPTVALSTIGALSYYSNAKVIDFIGLTDKYVAHNPKIVPGIAGKISVLWKERKYNTDYILENKPDYIIFPSGLKPSAYPEAAIFSKREFYNNYYPQLIFSEKMDIMLPVYTRKDLVDTVNIEENGEENCSIDFVEYYIRASNYLLEMNDANKVEKLERVSYYSDAAINSCRSRRDIPLALLGIANYHAGYSDRAEKLFEQAYQFNKYNSIAVFYLMKINFENKNDSLGVKFLRELKKLSPFALPGVLK